MNFLSRILLATALPATLVACSSAPSVKPDYSLAEAGKDGHGLLVISLSTDNPYSPYTPALEFNYGGDPTPNGDRGRKLEGPAGCNPSKPGDSDFSDACGRLFAVDLEAGDYYVLPWVMTLMPPVRNCAPTGWEPIRFTIAPGKATYLGNVHAQLKTGELDRLGNTKIGFAWALSRDQRARDLALLAERYPRLAAADVVYAPLDLPKADDPGHPPDSNCGNP